MTGLFLSENDVAALEKSPKMMHLGSDFILGLGLGLTVVGGDVVDDVTCDIDSRHAFDAAKAR